MPAAISAAVSAETAPCSASVAAETASSAFFTASAYETTAPWNLNIPQFIEIDLAGKMLSTTKASGENRSTPIRSLLREDGNIYLQGVEGGRAFSFVITEATGMASIAVAREDVTVSVFGVCTPLPAGK